MRDAQYTIGKFVVGTGSIGVADVLAQVQTNAWATLGVFLAICISFLTAVSLMIDVATKWRAWKAGKLPRKQHDGDSPDDTSGPHLP